MFCFFFNFLALCEGHSLNNLCVWFLNVLFFTLSLKNFIVDDFSSDDDFAEKKTSFKGISDITAKLTQ